MPDFFDRIGHSINVYGPKVLAALLILGVAYVVARILRAACATAIDKLPFLTKANETAKAKGGQTVGAGIGAAAFWIVILVGLVAALEQIGMHSVSTSIRATLDKIFAFLPQLIGAAITFFVFLIVGRVANQATTTTLEAAQADGLPQKMGVAEKPVPLSSILGSIVFALIIIPGGIAALQVLDIEAITRPAVNMLYQVMNAIPNIAVAIVIVGIFAVIARFVTNLLRKILPNSGLDNTVSRLGLLQDADSGVKMSGMLAQLAGIAILLLGLIQGMRTLGFEPLTQALNVILNMGARILFGSVIIFAGVLISGIVSRAMAATGSGATDFAANLVRYVIVVLSVILGVSRMGLDPSGTFITDAALIILIGTALAGGIAFGLGGKDWAARQLDKWK